MILILFFCLLFYYNVKSDNKQKTYDKDINNITNIMMNDSRLHRLLMIETLNYNKSIKHLPNDDIMTNDNIMINDESKSIEITYKKIISGIVSLGRSLNKYFGITISQKIIALMKQRNELLKEFYNKITDRFKNDDEFDDYNLDIVTLTSKKLENISRDIIDSISSSFNIRDVDTSSNKNRPLETYQRFYNLLTIYDKELLNQAKSYSIKNYDISINYSQSSLELTNHISDELWKLMLYKKKY
jgi:hypothetical protein